jgi:hypothetical protein
MGRILGGAFRGLGFAALDFSTLLDASEAMLAMKFSDGSLPQLIALSGLPTSIGYDTPDSFMNAIIKEPLVYALPPSITPFPVPAIPSASQTNTGTPSQRASARVITVGDPAGASFAASTGYIAGVTVAAVLASLLFFSASFALGVFVYKWHLNKIDEMSQKQSDASGNSQSERLAIRDTSWEARVSQRTQRSLSDPYADL